MITVFRSFSPDNNNALKFVKSEDIPFVEELDSKLFDYFYKKTAVTKHRLTRFGYEGCVSPLYFCENRDTTLFEYSYWLLKNTSELSKGIRVSTLTCKINHENDFEQIDIEGLEVKLRNKIMDISDTNYRNAHTWMTGLKKIPDVIAYNSIRDPSPGGKNFSIYSGNIEDISILKTSVVNFDKARPDSVQFIDGKRFITPIR